MVKHLRPRAWLQFLHLWLALTVGTIAVLTVATGTLLMFRPELEPLAYSGLYRASNGPPAPLVRVVEAVRAAHPGATLETLELPAVTHGAIRVQITTPDDTRATVFVDPATARVNGVQPQGGSAFDWLLSLHRELLMRPSALTEDTNYGHAHRLVGAVGLVLLTLLLSGAILWFPRGRSWRGVFQVRRKNAFLWNHDAHRLIGIAVLLPLAAMVAVVLPYAFFKETKAAMKAFPALEPPEAERRFGFGSDPLDLDGAVRKAEAFGPGLRAVRVQLETSPLLITLSSPQDFSRDTGAYQGDVTLGVSTSSGLVGIVQDSRTWNPAARLLGSSLYMGIHAGTWGGLPTRLLTLGVGLLTLYLAWTGVRQWWLKRLKRSRRPALQST